VPKIEIKAPEEKTVKRIRIRPTESFKEKITFDFTKKQPDIAGEDVIAFSRPGLQNKRFTQLRQGKSRIEATLDLHQHTSDEAIRATDNFLKQSHLNHLRSVCIIHGKGNYSADNKPIIKNLLNHYLRKHPLVLGFHSTKNKHGGAGAIYVLIKAK
jgi:DNA-nicking Smr family endonuclease